MANIKISELNALTERADNDLLAIVDTSADETKKIQVGDLINKNIELIAVSDTAPSECSIGDKYYNTTDKEIYTATGTNTWSETGTTPISGILYILTTDQKLYNYDGTDLVMVGGAGSIVHDNYSESTTEPYSANYVNNNIPDISNVYGTSQTDGYTQKYINNLNTYSTTEQRIGTWIDGKPIYRKVIEYRPSATIGEAGKKTTIQIAHNISNFDVLVNANGKILAENSGEYTLLPVFNSTTTQFSGFTLGTVIQNIGTTNISLGIFNDTWGTNRLFTFILEYTKTTD